MQSRCSRKRGGGGCRHDPWGSGGVVVVVSESTPLLACSAARTCHQGGGGEGALAVGRCFGGVALALARLWHSCLWTLAGCQGPGGASGAGPACSKQKHTPARIIPIGNGPIDPGGLQSGFSTLRI
jgi:hypothetical protein